MRLSNIGLVLLLTIILHSAKRSQTSTVITIFNTAYLLLISLICRQQKDASKLSFSSNKFNQNTPIFSFNLISSFSLRRLMMPGSCFSAQLHNWARPHTNERFIFFCNHLSGFSGFSCGLSRPFHLFYLTPPPSTALSEVIRPETFYSHPAENIAFTGSDSGWNEEQTDLNDEVRFTSLVCIALLL